MALLPGTRLGPMRSCALAAGAWEVRRPDGFSARRNLSSAAPVRTVRSIAGDLMQLVAAAARSHAQLAAENLFLRKPCGARSCGIMPAPSWRAISSLRSHLARTAALMRARSPDPSFPREDQEAVRRNHNRSGVWQTLHGGAVGHN